MRPRVPDSKECGRAHKVLQQTLAVLLQAFLHPDEIWGLSPSPQKPSLVLTCGNSASERTWNRQDGGTRHPFKVQCGAIAAVGCRVLMRLCGALTLSESRWHNFIQEQ